MLKTVSNNWKKELRTAGADKNLQENISTQKPPRPLKVVAEVVIMDKCYCTKVGLLGGQPIPHSHLETDEVSSPIRPDLPPIDEAISGGLEPDFSTPRRVLKNLPPIESVDSILEEILFEVWGADPYEVPTNKALRPAIKQLKRLIQTSNREARVDELEKLLADHNRIGVGAGYLPEIRHQLQTLTKEEK
jgi:hypothetical protein